MVSSQNRVLSSVLLCFHILCFVSSPSTRVLAQSSAVFACDVAKNPEVANYAFCDPKLDVKTRVSDLVKRLTLQEKIANLVNNAGGASRLGVPKYEWWSEALHGVSYVGPGTHFSSLVPGATSFPQVICTAASFNSSLFEAIGKVTTSLYHQKYFFCNFSFHRDFCIHFIRIMVLGFLSQKSDWHMKMYECFQVTNHYFHELDPNVTNRTFYCLDWPGNAAGLKDKMPQD